MIKKIVLNIGITIVIFCMGIVTCYLYGNLKINKLEEEKNSNQKKTYTEYDVFSDEFESYITYEGMIELSEEQEYFYEIELCYRKNNQECNFKLKKGDMLSKNVYIGNTYTGNKYTQLFSKNNLKIDNIVINEEEHKVILRVLNYDMLYYTVYMKRQDVSKIKYSTKVYYNDEDKEKRIPCKINYIGSEILDGDVIEVKISTKSSTKNLPGDKKKMNFVTDKKKKNLFLSADAVILKGNKAFVIKKIEDTYKEMEITIGQKVTINEGSDKYDYYVIKAGLDESDKVYAETISYNTDEGIKNVISE